MPPNVPPLEVRSVVPIKTDQARKGVLVVTPIASKIFTKNPYRLLLSMVNSSAQTVYLGFDKSVTIAGGSSPGYELLSNGTWDDDHYTGEWWAIVAGPNNSKITFIEMGLQQ
jgi:hypothetical protein